MNIKNTLPASKHFFAPKNSSADDAWLLSFYLVACIYLAGIIIETFYQFSIASDSSFEEIANIFVISLADSIVDILKFWLLYYFIYKKKWTFMLLLTIISSTFLLILKGPSIIINTKEAMLSYNLYSISFINSLYELIYIAGFSYYLISSIKLYGYRTQSLYITSNSFF
jgi:hypothetical protein